VLLSTIIGVPLAGRPSVDELSVGERAVEVEGAVMRIS
jgi:hypothetical protein